ncbi:hypothetical protein ACIBKX_20970 [Streptomyces sp. NPDC050658]|uniref:hypothetical protein n=1 Tax=unclassified Streptomyces TaxID=2593676 RepID=UPI00343B0183
MYERREPDRPVPDPVAHARSALATAPHPPYGLDGSWRGPRVVEEHQSTGGRLTRVMLGHGPRWVPDGDWLGVTTRFPRPGQTRVPRPRRFLGNVLEQELRRVNASLEHRIPGYRAPPGSVAAGEVIVWVEGAEYPAEVLRCGDVRLCELPVERNGLWILLTWTGNLPQAALVPVADTAPYVAGLRADLPRRRGGAFGAGS